MRGVEGNRVGVSIDGVSLPDSEENSLYARYGNFNNSRMSIDTELVRGIDVEKAPIRSAWAAAHWAAA